MDDFILTRRSVRKYDLTKEIDDETLLKLVNYGEAAPSARRQVSREYVIIKNKNMIDELSKVSKGSMILSECNTVIAVIGKNKEELITPHMQEADLAAATENILLGARMLNIGTCWIGIYPLTERMIPAQDIIGVKGGAFVYSLIALGYPLSEDAFYDAKKLDLNNVSFRR